MQKILFNRRVALIGRCLIRVRPNDQNETDTSETRGFPVILIWVRHLKQSLDRYEWEAKPNVDTDMTETPRPKLAQISFEIWLRRPKHFLSLFLILTQSQVCKIKMQEQNFLGRLSHICASLSRGVEVISVSTLSFASQSYRSKLCFKLLTHISFSSKPQFLLISVPFGSFCRTHIRHHPI